MEKLIVKNLTPVGNLTSTLSTSTGLVQIPGPKGEPGDSAYDVAVANGFKGSEQEWLASIKGDQGESGVYLGSEEPPNNVNIWIYSEGDASEKLATQKYVDDAIGGIEIPNLDDYATQSYVDDAIANIDIPEGGGSNKIQVKLTPNLSDEVKALIEEIWNYGNAGNPILDKYEIFYSNYTAIGAWAHTQGSKRHLRLCMFEGFLSAAMSIEFMIDMENKVLNQFNTGLITTNNIAEWIPSGGGDWSYTTDTWISDLYNAKEVYIRLLDDQYSEYLFSHFIARGDEGDILGQHTYQNIVFTTPEGLDNRTPYWNYDGMGINIYNFDGSYSDILIAYKT